MDPKQESIQEQDEHIPETETGETPDQEAVETPSPGETDGASSSDAADEAEKEQSAAEKIRDEFLKKYGDDDDGEEKAAVETEAKTEPEPKEPKAESEREKPDTTKDDSDDDKFRLSDKEFKSLPETARQRIGHLNARAKKAERLLADKDAEVETTRDGYERFNRIVEYTKANSIEPDDVTLAFGMMAKLRKGDFQGFLKDANPLIEAARLAAGEAYSPDLQEAIDLGEITEDRAKELTKLRAQDQRSKDLLTRHQQDNEVRQKGDNRSKAVASIAEAVNAREAELKVSDPDYAQKQAAVLEYMGRQLERLKKLGATDSVTKDDMVALVNEAHDYATKVTVRSSPNPDRQAPKRPTASSPPRGGPTPKTTKEAIEMAIEGYVPAH